MGVTFQVQDSQGPTIRFENVPLIVEVGQVVDLSTFINEVRDLAEGELSYALTPIETSEQGYYTIESTLDTSIEGKHSFKVIAVDNHGNKATD